MPIAVRRYDFDGGVMKSLAMNPSLALELSNAKNRATQRFISKAGKRSGRRFLSTKASRQIAVRPRKMRVLARFLPRHNPKMIRQSGEE